MGGVLSGFGRNGSGIGLDIKKVVLVNFRHLQDEQLRSESDNLADEALCIELKGFFYRDPAHFDVAGRINPLEKGVCESWDSRADEAAAQEQSLHTQPDRFARIVYIAEIFEDGDNLSQDPIDLDPGSCPIGWLHG